MTHETRISVLSVSYFNAKIIEIAKPIKMVIWVQESTFLHKIQQKVYFEIVSPNLGSDFETGSTMEHVIFKSIKI